MPWLCSQRMTGSAIIASAIMQETAAGRSVINWHQDRLRARVSTVVGRNCSELERRWQRSSLAAGLNVVYEGQARLQA